jgi:hypothetical protein
MFCGIPFTTRILPKGPKGELSSLARTVTAATLTITMAVSIMSQMWLIWKILVGSLEYSPVNRNAILLLFLCNVLTKTTILGSSIWNRRKYAAVYEKIFNIHVSVIGLCSYQSVKWLRNLFYLATTCLFGMVMMNFYLQYLYSGLEDMSTFLLLFSMLAAYSISMDTLSLANYLSLLFVVKYEYKRINRYLQATLNSEKVVQKPKSIMKYILETLADLHLQLDVLMQKLNELYSFVLFGKTLQFAISLVTKISISYHRALDEELVYIYSGHNGILILAPDAITVLILLAAYYLNEETRKERDKTSHILHLSQSSRPEVEVVLETFANQVLHCKFSKVLIFRIVPINLGTMLAVSGTYNSSKYIPILLFYFRSTMPLWREYSAYFKRTLKGNILHRTGPNTVN